MLLDFLLLWFQTADFHGYHKTEDRIGAENTIKHHKVIVLSKLSPSIFINAKDYCKHRVNSHNSEKVWFVNFGLCHCFYDKQIFKGPYSDISDVLLPSAAYTLYDLTVLYRILKLNLHKIRIIPHLTFFSTRLWE